MRKRPTAAVLVPASTAPTKALGTPANAITASAGSAVWWQLGVVVLVAARVVAALTLMITDCDETFNYWEPTHFVRKPFKCFQPSAGEESVRDRFLRQNVERAKILR